MYNAVMLIDEVDIVLQAGHGGPGKVSFYPGKKSGPDGGNGGRGGDIFITTTSDLTALNQFSGEKLIKAKNGEPGDSNRKFGQSGVDIELKMPVGTILIDKITGEEFNLSDIGERILICKGGLGGRGNFELKSSRNTTPMYAQKGLPGQVRDLKIILKLIADIGLIGLPNAGKSSLLNEITSANVKTADYPFTTLEPNLGVVDKKIIADIPGLIAGASTGKGLGIKFLKHVEKVKVLFHCISSDSLSSLEDYEVVRAELGKFNEELLQKKEIIILTKTDLLDKKELEQKIKLLKKVNKEIITVSIYDWDSLQHFKETISNL